MSLPPATAKQPAHSDSSHHDGEVVVGSVRVGPENQVLVRSSEQRTARPGTMSAAISFHLPIRKVI
jgi:hypothetical protein